MENQPQIESQEIIYTTAQMEDYMDHIALLEFREKFLMSQLEGIDEFYSERTQIADEQTNLYQKTSANNLAEKQWRFDKMTRSQQVVDEMAELKQDLMVQHETVVMRQNEFLAQHAKNLENSYVHNSGVLYAYNYPPSPTKRGRLESFPIIKYRKDI